MLQRDKSEKMKKTEKYCRTCYGHLAGKIGVEVCKSLMQQKLIVAREGIFVLTPKGESFFESFGIETNELRNNKRAFTKACIDGSEKQLHLGGSLGVAFTNQLLKEGWFKQIPGTRALEVTPKGKKELAYRFNVTTDNI